ncbi:MAG: response regulator [Lachnospiraceae bacterium]|nr:response regulator [Lachnospiraceae bacterium]
MFRILVADDEKVTRRGIVAMLQRGLKEEIECLEAGNGQEALEIARRTLIHLIVTDICMPLLSGLEFVQELQKTDPQTTVIIISGYENFEFAKQAVRLGVKDYILKPVNKEELLGIAEKCLADIQKKQMEARQLYIESRQNKKLIDSIKRESFLELFSGKRISESLDRLASFGIRLDSPFFQCAIVEYEMKEEFDEVIDFAVENIVDETLEKYFSGWFLTIPYCRGSLAFVAQMEEMEQSEAAGAALLKAVLNIEKYTRIKSVVGMGSLAFEPENISVSFEESRSAAEFKIYDENRRLLLYSQIPPGEMDAEALSTDFAHLFRTAEEAEILSVFHKLLRMPMSIESMKGLRNAYHELYQLASGQLSDCLSFSQLWSPFELRREAGRMVQCIKEVQENGEEEENNQLIQEIIRFTVKHVTEDIDLNYIAERFAKTPGYVGMLFRRGAGCGFNEFVTGERIKKAKKLLKDPTVSVQRVGELCGYYNPKYFSVVFKKVTGISPRAYQKGQGEK